MAFLPSKWKFNEIGSIASVLGAVLSVAALVITVKPELITKDKK